MLLNIEGLMNKFEYIKFNRDYEGIYHADLMYFDKEGEKQTRHVRSHSAGELISIVNNEQYK